MTLTDARKALGWTQLKLDRKAKLVEGTTQQIESGRIQNPSWAIVSAITEAFRVAGLVGLTAHDLFPTDTHVEARG